MSVCIYKMLLVHSLYAVMQFYNQISAVMKLLHLVMLTHMTTANVGSRAMLCDMLQVCLSITSAMQI